MRVYFREVMLPGVVFHLSAQLSLLQLSIFFSLSFSVLLQPFFFIVLGFFITMGGLCFASYIGWVVDLLSWMDWFCA